MSPVVFSDGPCGGTPVRRRRQHLRGWPWLAWLLAAGLLAGCAAGRPRAPVVFDAAPYRQFVTPRPLLPFRAEGSVLFTYRDDREAGDMALQATAGRAFRLQLLARLTGSLELELRFDPERLLVLDYANKTYYAGPNTADTRLRLFDVDLNPDEFLMLLTGRVPRALFAAGGGAVRAAPPATGLAALGATGGAAPAIAEFRAGDALYRFWLDGTGLPQRWVKLNGGAEVFRVEYREYAEVPMSAGPPLRVPRKIRLYLHQRTPTMVLGIRTFSPGEGGQPAIVLTGLPESARSFAPGTLPERPAR